MSLTLALPCYVFILECLMLLILSQPTKREKNPCCIHETFTVEVKNEFAAFWSGGKHSYLCCLVPLENMVMLTPRYIITILLPVQLQVHHIAYVCEIQKMRRWWVDWWRANPNLVTREERKRLTAKQTGSAKVLTTRPSVLMNEWVLLERNELQCYLLAND